MANRYPLIIDVNDNNKIKEIPTGDNLTLQGSSIVQVQDITATGTINAGDIRLNGNRLVAQTFSDLIETPSSFQGSQDYFLKVNAAGDGIVYRPLSDLGNIQLDSLTLNSDIIPSVNASGSIGTDQASFARITATNLKGNLLSLNDELVFNAGTGLISYAAIQGAPSSLSEFNDDVGYLKVNDLSTTINNLPSVSTSSITVSNLLTLGIITAEPGSPQNGMIAIADGTNWNPTSSGVQTMVVYLGGAWKQIQTA